MTSLLNETIESQWTVRNAVSHYKVLELKYATITATYAAMTIKRTGLYFMDMVYK